MKVIPQYKVIGPYNYDRIMHNIETNYARRQDVGQTNGKMHLILKIKICVIRLCKHFQPPWKWSILPAACTALGDLHIHTKHILAHDQLYCQLHDQCLQKINDRLYIRVCTFNKIYYYQWQEQQVPDKQQVADKWRDACKLTKLIKFGAVSYNN